MDAQSQAQTPSAYGAPRLTRSGLDILAFTLHRYVAPFLVERKLESVRIAIGFEGSALPPVIIEVSDHAAKPITLEGFDFDTLAAATRSGAQAVTLRDEGTQHLAAIAVADRSEESSHHLLGFVLLAANTPWLSDAHLVEDLAMRASEAIRSARNNEIRMLFDAQGQMPIKAFLYRVLDQLPDWCGVDHSAALILTGSLGAMAMSSLEDAEFEIVAERLYFDPPAGHFDDYERLVGLTIEVGDGGGLLGASFARLREDAGEFGLYIYLPDDANHWHLFGESDRLVQRFATRVTRPQEEMTVLVPLLTRDELGHQEMLGFLSLNFRKPMPIMSGSSQLLEMLGERLGEALRRSPLFGLSARQLLLLEAVRTASNTCLSQTEDGAVTRLEAYLGTTIERVAQASSVPGFGIGYITHDGRGDRVIRFAKPHGFTRFADVILPVVPPDESVRSSIAALAVRLTRPVVLAGGHSEGDTFFFKNDMFVNEEAGLIVDARRVDPYTLTDTGTWRELSDYFIASRDDSYATLAYPISIAGEVLGVIAIEVDRNTDWLWWTGFGSQLFYRLLANELSVVFKLLGVPNL